MVGGHVAYFRECTRHDVNTAMAVAHEPGAKYLDGTEKFGQLVFLGGSDQLLKNDRYFLSIAPELRGKMNPLEAVLVNL